MADLELDFDEGEGSKMAVIESENFAVYSDIEFLYMIGQYAAQSKSNYESGLQSLNDYLLILDHTKDTQPEKEYYKKRALAVYQMGLILYNNQDLSESAKYFALAIEDLRASDQIKEADSAQLKFTQYWQS